MSSEFYVTIGDEVTFSKTVSESDVYLFAGITDIIGGRSGAYEASLGEARETALRELEERAQAMGANAVVGVDLDYEVINNMLMVSASGTAVTLR